jgi:hypothetical protein
MKSLDKPFNKLNIPFFSYTGHIVHTALLITAMRAFVLLSFPLFDKCSYHSEYVHVVQLKLGFEMIF